MTSKVGGGVFAAGVASALVLLFVHETQPMPFLVFVLSRVFPLLFVFVGVVILTKMRAMDPRVAEQQRITEEQAIEERRATDRRIAAAGERRKAALAESIADLEAQLGIGELLPEPEQREEHDA